VRAPAAAGETAGAAGGEGPDAVSTPER
jgi:hypothetical protein